MQDNFVVLKMDFKTNYGKVTGFVEHEGKKIEQVTISISSTGDDCIIIDGNNTCTNNSRITLDQYMKKVIPIDVKYHRS